MGPCGFSVSHRVITGGGGCVGNSSNNNQECSEEVRGVFFHCI